MRQQFTALWSASVCPLVDSEGPRRGRNTWISSQGRWPPDVRPRWHQSVGQRVPNLHPRRRVEYDVGPRYVSPGPRAVTRSRIDVQSDWRPRHRGPRRCEECRHSIREIPKIWVVPLSYLVRDLTHRGATPGQPDCYEVFDEALEGGHGAKHHRRIQRRMLPRVPLDPRVYGEQLTRKPQHADESVNTLLEGWGDERE